MSKFYPQIPRTEASYHIYTSPQIHDPPFSATAENLAKTRLVELATGGMSFQVTVATRQS